MNKVAKEAAWAEAKKRCGLSDAEIRMAKELRHDAEKLDEKHSRQIANVEGTGPRLDSRFVCEQIREPVCSGSCRPHTKHAGRAAGKRA